jgi:hypothetical protein
MWDDASDSPYVMHLAVESFDVLPGPPPPGRLWECSVWTELDGQPHKSLERICYWRRVKKIPCLQRWHEVSRPDGQSRTKPWSETS